MSTAEVWDDLPAVFVPFGWRHFFRKYGLLLRAEGNLLSVLGQMTARVALLGAVQSGWWADAVFAPGWKRAKMRGPVFIIGHQRSGTTLMHRLLASDTAHARALTFQEMLLPAISIQGVLHAIGATDARFGRRLSTWFSRKQDALFGPMDAIHRIRFDEIEEDEFVLWGIFASAMCANDAPASTGTRALDELRDFHGWPERRQRQALGWYRACLLKKVYREPGDDVWVVGKNPAFSQKIPELLHVFPDAKFVHLVRNPFETIPSRLSLIRAIWRQRFSEDVDMTPSQVETIVEDSVRTYTLAHRDLAALADDPYVTIQYESFLSDVAGTIESIYGRFNLGEPDDHLHEALTAQASSAGPRHSHHHYSLDEFGLEKESIRSRLSDVMDHYGF